MREYDGLGGAASAGVSADAGTGFEFVLKVVETVVCLVADTEAVLGGCATTATSVACEGSFLTAGCEVLINYTDEQ